MSIKVKLKYDWIKIIITAILLILVSNIVSYLLSLRIPYTERNQDSSNIEIISFITSGIILVALLNKSKSILDSIFKGIKIAFVAGILFFASYYLYFFYLQISYNDRHYDNYLIFLISIYFTIFWLVSSILGMLISYITRKYIEQKKSI